MFLYCDWNFVSGSQRQNQRELVASAGAHGLSICLCHAMKHVKGPYFKASVMEKSWKKY